ncbi:YrdB family protein [Nocardia sp. XZ_19_385]|uniref:YrdB family protein n=1 Tax=Nocardia sp. XZ_19_385 TaxID=2769488 RepID=UPI00188FC0FE|nr:YrdB family protein [Nocardia sp. XZ_19_385]
MRIVKGANLLLMLLLELGVIAGAAAWGFTLDGSTVLRVVAGVIAPLLFIAMWALFGAAGDARFRLRGPWRIALELIWFGGGAVAWGAAAGPVLGVLFFALWAINALIRFLGDGTLQVEVPKPRAAQG